MAGDAHVGLWDENDLLIVDEAWVLAPCCNEELAVIIFRAHIWRSKLDLSTRPAQDGLCHGHGTRVQGNTPHPYQHPVVEGSCSCH
jgi:hypothetical protein